MTKLRKRRVTLPRSIRRLFPKVKKAFDSAVPIEVDVKSEDCREARRLDPTECALARAAKRELKADGVVIGISTSYVIKGDRAVRFATPESVRREIVSFDRHQDFAPGNYHLPPKSPSNRLGETHKCKDKRKRHDDASKKKVIHHSARIRVFEPGSTDTTDE